MTMRVLIVFIFLITIVGCSKDKEPSVLERCIATNSEEVNYYDKFVPHFKEVLRLNDIVNEAIKNNNPMTTAIFFHNLLLLGSNNFLIFFIIIFFGFKIISIINMLPFIFIFRIFFFEIFF